MSKAKFAWQTIQLAQQVGQISRQVNDLIDVYNDRGYGSTGPLTVSDVNETPPGYAPTGLTLTLAQFGEIVDHMNHNTLDYRRENLRIVSSSQNTRNRKSKNSNNTSGYRNVTKMGNYWRVQLQQEGKNVLFREKFTDPKEAGAFADARRAEFYGAFAGNG